LDSNGEVFTRSAGGKKKDPKKRRPGRGENAKGKGHPNLLSGVFGACENRKTKLTCGTKRREGKAMRIDLMRMGKAEGFSLRGAERTYQAGGPCVHMLWEGMIGGERGKICQKKGSTVKEKFKAI